MGCSFFVRPAIHQRRPWPRGELRLLEVKARRREVSRCSIWLPRLSLEACFKKCLREKHFQKVFKCWKPKSLREDRNVKKVKKKLKGILCQKGKSLKKQSIKFIHNEQIRRSIDEKLKNPTHIGRLSCSVLEGRERKDTRRTARRGRAHGGTGIGHTCLLSEPRKNHRKVRRPPFVIPVGAHVAGLVFPVLVCLLFAKG